MKFKVKIELDSDNVLGEFKLALAESGREPRVPKEELQDFIEFVKSDLEMIVDQYRSPISDVGGLVAWFIDGINNDVGYASFYKEKSK